MLEWPRYTARPYVCGALGESSRALVDRLRAAGPSVETVLDLPDAVLLSSAPLTPYADGAYAWGSVRPPRGGPWLSIAEEFETPGLVSGPDSVTLHTGAFGLIDVYYVMIGDAVYFAERLGPLLGLLDGPLAPDWGTWASILLLTCPLGDATPYADVRRLTGATGLTWSRTARRLSLDRRMPRWVRDEPLERGVSGADMVDALRGSLEGLDEPVLVPLSGGYDSRLLASAALANGLPVESWTTSPDDGQDVDIAYARTLARELGVQHRVIMPSASTWPSDAQHVAHRLEFQTQHHQWFVPFARELRDDGRPVVDGLAGGPLMKNFLISDDALSAGTSRDRLAAVLESLSVGTPHIPVLAPEALAWTESSVAEQFAAAVSMVQGHRAELALSVLHTRTARGISRSPVSLIGPESRAIFPFMDPVFFDAALSVSAPRKRSGRFYREILRAAHPRVAALPSTNERMPNHRVRLRSSGSAARTWLHAQMLKAASVPGLVSAEMMETLDQGPSALASFSSWESRFWLRGLALFGAWLGEFEDRVGDLTPPWKS